MPEPLIIVFLKAPRPGFVKTRLAKTLGPKAACRAYTRMTAAVLDRLSNFSNVQLRFTPDDAEAEIAHLLRPGWQSFPQGAGSLGERMDHAFRDANGPALLIGTDCPDLNASDIREATAALSTHPVILGPARDGGYWLIGLQAPCPPLFQGISWSTSSVFHDTLRIAQQSGQSVHQLRTLTDIDDEDTWKKWSG